MRMVTYSQVLGFRCETYGILIMVYKNLQGPYKFQTKLPLKKCRLISMVRFTARFVFSKILLFDQFAIPTLSILFWQENLEFFRTFVWVILVQCRMWLFTFLCSLNVPCSPFNFSPIFLHVYTLTYLEWNLSRKRWLLSTPYSGLLYLVPLG